MRKKARNNTFYPHLLCAFCGQKKKTGFVKPLERGGKRPVTRPDATETIKAKKLRSIFRAIIRTTEKT